MENRIKTKHVIIEGKEYWEATVEGLPDLAEYGETEAEVIELAKDSIVTTTKHFADKMTRL